MNLKHVKVGVLFIVTLFSQTVCAQLPVYNVKDFGAIGDGKTLDTQAIQKAIDQADPNGAIVRIPAGKYLVGTIKFKSNLELDVMEGAVVLGSKNTQDYADDVQIAVEAPSFSKCVIYAENCKNIKLTGYGQINGQASWEYFSRKKGRPMLIRFVECQNVVFNDITLKDAGSWCVHLVNCDQVVADRVKMDTRLLKNNDGFDMDGCKDVLIQNCDLKTGDDTICPKSTTKRLSENIVVRNCRISSHTAAFKCGTSSYGGFKNISFINNHVYDCRMGVIKLLIVDGGMMENILVSDITMENVEGPIFIRLGNRGRMYQKPTEQVYSKEVSNEGASVGSIRNITIRNLSGTVTGDVAERQGIMLTGIPGHLIEHVIIENMKLSYTGFNNLKLKGLIIPEDEAVYPEQKKFGVLTSYGMFLRHVKGLKVKNVAITLRNPDDRSAIIFDDVQESKLDNIKFDIHPKAGSGIIVKNSRDIKFNNIQSIGEAERLMTVDNNSKNVQLE